jgi:hypothetical protein
MSGEELSDINQSIGYQFCRLSDGHPINLAHTGASNDRIYDTTIEYLKTSLPDFVLIGWSEMSRLQWYTTAEGPGRFYEINNLGIGRQPLPEEYQERYNHWQQHMVEDYKFLQAMGLYWREKIYNMHCLLTDLKVPHLFFHVFHRFHVYKKEHQLNWHNRFIDPYVNIDSDSGTETPPFTYTNWCQRQGYQEITPGFYHYEPAAQLAWAELLVQHVSKHNLLVI